ncbi:hypothetical protein NL676_008965 [Syzygium grande]|nr:hypothetical protein NL676_008965 [Syzygium grande]
MVVVKLGKAKKQEYPWPDNPDPNVKGGVSSNLKRRIRRKRGVTSLEIGTTLLNYPAELSLEIGTDSALHIWIRIVRPGVLLLLRLPELHNNHGTCPPSAQPCPDRALTEPLAKKEVRFKSGHEKNHATTCDGDWSNSSQTTETTMWSKSNQQDLGNERQWCAPGTAPRKSATSRDRLLVTGTEIRPTGVGTLQTRIATAQIQARSDVGLSLLGIDLSSEQPTGLSGEAEAEAKTEAVEKDRECFGCSSLGVQVKKGLGN